MKGTIISVNEILELINEGNMEKVSRVFEIYRSGGMHIVNLTDLTIKDFIKDCINDNVIFIKIETTLVSKNDNN